MAAAPPLWRRTRSSGRAERFGHVRERARCTGLTSMSPDREVSVSMPDGLFCQALRGGTIFFSRVLASLVQATCTTTFGVNPRSETRD